MNNLVRDVLTQDFWQYTFWENTVQDYALAFGIFIAAVILLHLFQQLLLSRLERLAKKTRTDVDDTFLYVVESIRPPFYFFIAFYIALSTLTLSGIVEKVINVILVVWIVYQAVTVFQIVIDYIITKKMGGEENANGSQFAIDVVNMLLKIALWIVGFLFILSNFGIDITSLIAGLGIGGIAVALALQNILGDLFSYFAIHFDKPFKTGDFVIVGQDMGVVQKVGVKTTRIKALQGEEIVIPNQELTSARIQNFKRMEERRVVFSFGIVYETPTAKLKEIPRIIKKIIEESDQTRFDRAHFYRFDEYALTFEVVYYVLSSDYNTYMDIHQNIHFKIKEIFEEKGITMAYPTRTIYLESEQEKPNKKSSK